MNGNQKCLATKILQNDLFCIPQSKETHTGLEILEGEEMMTRLSFLGASNVLKKLTIISMWTICCHYHLKCISSLTPVINHKVPSPPPCYALYLSFFRSSWLIITSWPDASWDFLVMDSSSASKRVFSLTSPSAAFSPKRTFSFKATHKMQLCLLLEVEQNITSIIL